MINNKDGGDDYTVIPEELKKTQHKNTVDTQIRLGTDLYNYIKSEADRLNISMNYTMNGILDDGRRFRQSTFIFLQNEIQTKE